MPRNVEIKARVHDLAALEQRVRKLAQERQPEEPSAGEPTVLHQRDTFFGIPDGRLKVRDFGDGTGELIFYRRPDATGPKTSHYRKSESRDPQALRALLTEALGVVGEVVKKRWVWVIGRTRVHLDRVERLGDFIELEVVLDEGETEIEAAAEARALMAMLGVTEEDLVEGAYIDHATMDTKHGA